MQPSAEEIALRAGVSRRSVFNHFGDLGELYDAVFEVGMQRDQGYLELPSAHQSLAEKIRFFLETRTSFLEATAPFTRALTAQVLGGRPRSEHAWRISQEGLNAQQNQIAEAFGNDLISLPDGERNQTLEAIHAAFAPLTWEYLRHSRGLSIKQARETVGHTLKALLRQANLDVDSGPPPPGTSD
ncbi:MAG: TetR/AcrR family transcriptional regulator [Myxococcota bacterium]|nr:TetR/AcrR family transcriptional regulator [Myxococcota bacterium]